MYQRTVVLIVPWSPVLGQDMTRKRGTLPHVCLSAITPSHDHLPGLPLSLHVCILEAISYLGQGTHYTHSFVYLVIPPVPTREERIQGYFLSHISCLYFRKKQHIVICSCNTTSRLGLCERSGEVMCTKCYHAQELLNVYVVQTKDYSVMYFDRIAMF